MGKQPNKDVWVFNENTQMNKEGLRIAEEDLEYIVIEDDRLPLLKNVSGGKVFSLSFLCFLSLSIGPPSLPPSFLPSFLHSLSIHSFIHSFIH